MTATTDTDMPSREDTQIVVDLGRKLHDDIHSTFMRTADLAPQMLPSLAHSASAAATGILASVLDLGNENKQSDERSPTRAAFVLASLMQVHYALGASDPLTPAMDDLKKYLPEAKFNRARFGVATVTDVLSTRH